VHLLGWYDGEEVRYGIKIPKLLSFLSSHHWNAEVKGLDTVRKDGNLISLVVNMQVLNGLITPALLVL
jgi:cytochrome bd-type quinol oxidase subunit 1